MGGDAEDRPVDDGLHAARNDPAYGGAEILGRPTRAASAPAGHQDLGAEPHQSVHAARARYDSAE